MKKATDEQKVQMEKYQDDEFKNIELTQQMQYDEFTKAWDDYMQDYEATAYLSLEKLKERHMQEFQDLDAS